MRNIDLLISARWILPIAPENTVLENYALAVNKDKIIDLLPLDAAKEQYYAEQYLEFPDHVIMPGLVNSHTHTPMNLFRGLADDLPLMDWLNNHIWPAEGALINAESVRAGTQLAIAEMLRGGTTCFNDNYFFPDITASAAIETGMRVVAGNVIMSVPTKWAADEAGYFTRAEAILRDFTPHPLVTWTITPHAPYTVSDDSFKKVREISEKHNLPVHLHLHETSFECEQSAKEFGVRPIARLQKLGLINEKLIAVHMVDVNAQEMEVIAKAGASVVHCPESNLKLASGFAPVAEYLKHGINVALGTDGAASNNDLDMFGELRTAAMIAKAVSSNPTSVPAHEALKMATLNGAKAIGLGDKIGSLEKNKQADFIAIDLSSYLTQPIFNPLSSLAYAANRLQVSDVWIAGKRLLKNGEFTRLDTKKIVAEAKVWAEKAREFEA